MVGVELTWTTALIALGAFMAGIGSVLSGIAAIRRKRNGGKNGNDDHKHPRFMG